ncbi:hypothetical protein HDV00_007949 [Rhizophlyctis rosea]|nr:hypothetical protein HDV00_007949 [Rhizophlyctis rosea]
MDFRNQRLLRELKEFHQDPPAGISVHQKGDQIDSYCVILHPLESRLQGLRLHLDLTFPHDYPFSPPKVTASTKIYNQFILAGGYICCDVLQRDVPGKAEGYNGGYTPASTLSSLLVQLMSLLSSDHVTSMHSGTEVDVQYARNALWEHKDAVKFTCKHCRYNMAGGIAVVDNVRKWKASQMRLSVTSMAAKNIVTKFPRRPSLPSSQAAIPDANLIIPKTILKIIPNVWLDIAYHLSADDIRRLSLAIPPFGALMYPINIRRQLTCFITRQNLHEDILGVGLSISGRVVTPVFDLISHKAFKAGVRMSVWKKPFTHFLPLALDGTHFRRGLPVLLDCVDQIAKLALSDW